MTQPVTMPKLTTGGQKALFYGGAAFLALVAAAPLIAIAAGGFSQGCRMGEVTKLSVKGWLNPSGEGQMLIGRVGAPYTYAYGTGDDAVTKMLSPWHFSSTDGRVSLWPLLEAAFGSYQVLCYEQVHFNSGMSASADYRVVSLTPPTRETPDLEGRLIEKPNAAFHDGGVRAGRVVKASFKGTFVKSYEVIVRLGNSGSDYLEMSISDEHMYQCAMRALESGQKVRLSYVEYVWNIGRDTNYDIYGIELVDDL